MTLEEQKNFISNLDRATKIVKSWPKWKQDVLAEAMDGNYKKCNHKEGKNMEGKYEDKLVTRLIYIYKQVVDTAKLLGDLREDAEEVQPAEPILHCFNLVDMIEARIRYIDEQVKHLR